MAERTPRRGEARAGRTPAPGSACCRWRRAWAWPGKCSLLQAAYPLLLECAHLTVLLASMLLSLSPKDWERVTRDAVHTLFRAYCPHVTSLHIAENRYFPSTLQLCR